MYLTLWSALSSRKLARMDALSFWMTALSSAIVFAARTLRMNCLTVGFRVCQRVASCAGLWALGRCHLRELMMGCSGPARGPGGGF